MNSDFLSISQVEVVIIGKLFLRKTFLEVLLQKNSQLLILFLQVFYSLLISHLIDANQSEMSTWAHVIDECKLAV